MDFSPLNASKVDSHRCFDRFPKCPLLHISKAIANAQKRFPALNFADDVNTTLKDAEIVLHLTEWKIYREIDPVKVKSIVKTPIIIDGRNALDRELWQSAGWKFRALGRSHNE